MNTVVAKLHFRLNRRLAIAGIIFLFMFVTTYSVNGFSGWNSMPQNILPIPNWLFWMLLLSLAVAFTDVIIFFILLMGVEYVLILAFAYGLSFTGAFRFHTFFRLMGTPEWETVTGIGLFLIDIIWYFSLIERIKMIFPRGNQSEWNKESQYDQYNPRADDTISGEKFTKEELARLLNLWNMKYANSKTDEERKIANEKISEYKDQLQRIRKEDGTTPERA
jgi:hypothetical protein